MPYGFDLKSCPKCQGPLVDDRHVDREAAKDGVTCRIRGIPTRRCAGGCPGTYMYHVDYGVEVFDAWTAYTERTAKRPFFAFRAKHLCPSCKTVLEDAGRADTFEFTAQIRNGTQTLVTLTAPALKCPTCRKLFLPAVQGQFDPFYIKLAAVIDAALSDDLLRE